MWIVLVRGFSARMSHETVNWIRTKAFPTFFFVSTTLLCTTIRLFANKLAPSVLTVPVEFSTRIIGAFMMSRFDHFPSETGALWRQGLAIAMLLEGVLFISVVGRRFKSICPCIARSYCQVLRQSFLLPSCLLASAAALITAAICSRRWHRKELQLRTVLFWLVVIILGALGEPCCSARLSVLLCLICPLRTSIRVPLVLCYAME